MSRRTAHRAWLAVSVVTSFIAGCGESPETIARLTSEKQANRILVELESAGLDPTRSTTTDRKGNTYEIRVPKDRAPDARRRLVDLDLPREEQSGFEGMLARTGLIPTKSDEQAELIYAVSQELSQTLEAVDRVVRARVHVVWPEDQIGMTHEAPPAARASVLIKYLDAADAPHATYDGAGTLVSPQAAASSASLPIGPRDVAKLVIGSVPRLSEQDVSVTYSPTARSSDRPAPPPHAPAATHQQSQPTEGEPQGAIEWVRSKLVVIQFGIIVLMLAFILYLSMTRGTRAA